MPSIAVTSLAVIQYVDHHVLACTCTDGDHLKSELIKPVHVPAEPEYVLVLPDGSLAHYARIELDNGATFRVRAEDGNIVWRKPSESSPGGAESIPVVFQKHKGSPDTDVSDRVNVGDYVTEETHHGTEVHGRVAQLYVVVGA